MKNKKIEIGDLVRIHQSSLTWGNKIGIVIQKIKSQPKSSSVIGFDDHLIILSNNHKIIFSKEYIDKL